MNLENLQAYEMIAAEKIKEADSFGYLLRHKKSGARVFLLENEDDNKVFYVGFRTPPTDDTGVAHILEHSVLCGSKKYPVKDPFVELAKGSLNTFLNAMTYPDKTLYPLASCNDKDFQNLMSVYMDAVFYPNIYTNEKIFEQEGWHYEFEQADGKLTYNGVVYNEMKGSYSAPESVLRYEVLKALFPTGTYGKSSGGDPKAIPSLTYGQFLDFHSKYYHPSNSFIYLYGNMDMEERLNWMDQEYLKDFEQIEVDSQVVQEPRFSEWVEKEAYYSVTEEDLTDKTFLAWSVLAGDCLDMKEAAAFQIVEYALLNAPGAPIKQALIDAGIGKDVMGGYQSGIRQPYFSIIAKGANPEQKEEFTAIIRRELEKAVAEGLDKKSILGGINSMEFRSREADFGRWPRGLMYGLGLENWLYDEMAPMSALCYEPVYDWLRQVMETDYFEQLIKERLLQGTHGAVVTLAPKQNLTAEQDTATAQILAEYQAGLSQQELEQIAEHTVQLKEYQQEPSPKEDLEKIPMLQREDLSDKVFHPINDWKKAGEQDVLFHSVFTSGIGYLKLGFDASNVAQEDLGYLSLLTSLLSYIDTEKYSYRELSNEVNIHTGGMGFTTLIQSGAETCSNPKVWVWCNAKALYRELDWTLDTMEEVLLHSDFTSAKRIRELVAEEQVSQQSSVVNNGHSTAISRAKSYCFEDGYLNDLMSGLDYYDFITDLQKNIDARMEQLAEKLKTIAAQVFTREGMFVSYTADEEGLAALEKPLEAFVQKLPQGEQTQAARSYPMEVKNEGLKTSSQVQYVARVGDFRKAGFDYTGAMQVFRTIMSYDYLWIKLRVQGGAYGCFAQLSRKGFGYFCSYRDPNLEQTNAVYEAIPEYLEQFDAGENEMTRYIIGTISEMDTPMTPSMKGSISLTRYLTGLTTEQCEKERKEILNCTPEDIRKLAEPVRAILQQQVLCAVGNAGKIEENQGMFKEKKTLA